MPEIARLPDPPEERRHLAMGAALHSGDGDGTSGGMEARVAKLEAAVQHIQADIGEIKSDLREIKRDARSDFRLIFGALIATALGLAGLLAKGFGWY